MYQPMLFLHWKQIRVGLIPLALASFGFPLLMVQGLGSVPGLAGPSLDAFRLARDFAGWSGFFPVLAAAIGMTLALSAWNWDHQLKHVYALSLPMARWEYAMLKMGAGAALALVPAAALWLGAHLAVASVTIPDGLHAYPNQLALRFLIAILLSYAVIFAMAAGTIKTTIWVASAFFGFLILSAISADYLAQHFVLFQQQNPFSWVMHWLFNSRGPFEVFNGHWVLIDV